jgi:hypothetical protein
MCDAPVVFMSSPHGVHVDEVSSASAPELIARLYLYSMLCWLILFKSLSYVFSPGPVALVWHASGMGRGLSVFGFVCALMTWGEACGVVSGWLEQV